MEKNKTIAKMDQLMMLPELWPLILRHLDVWQRYCLVTVCKDWSKPCGYIEQSIERLSKEDRYMRSCISRMPNLKTPLVLQFSFSLVSEVNCANKV